MVYSLLLLSPLVLLLSSAIAKRLSEFKCHEFSKKNVRISWGAALTVNPEPIAFTAPSCSDSVDLIVNGEEANEGEFPHQAALGYVTNETGMVIIGGYWFKCGGSLISERFVLTAAHCGIPKIVRLGVNNLNLVDDGELFEVEKFFRHPKYYISASYDDIALVKTSREVSFSSHQRPACLWTNTALNLSTVMATGFGNLDYALENSNHLMKVRLQIKDKELCKKKFKNQRKFKLGIQKEQLCIGSQKEGTDTCQGDSGGPLQTVTDAKTCMYHIVALTSTGASCGGGKANNVYIQVASYLSWIEDRVWPGQRPLYEIEDNY